MYWTLAVEFQFYLVFGILFPLAAIILRRSPNLAVMLCASFAFVAFAAPLLPNVQLLKYAPCFALGIVIAGRFLYSVKPLVMLWLAALVSFAGWSTGLGASTIIGSSGAALVASFMTHPVNRDLPWIKPFWWVGTVSYLLYVTHQALASAGESVARFSLRLNHGLVGQVVANLVPFGTLAASLSAAWPLYRFVEIPSLTLSKSLRR